MHKELLDSARIKKELSPCEAFGAVGWLVHPGVRKVGARSILRSFRYPTAVLCLGWGHVGREFLLTHFLFTFSCKISKEKENSDLLELTIRSLPGSPLQTWQSEKYAQSYLVQKLGTSQISVQIQKRHSLLAFSQGHGQTFPSTCSQPVGEARFLPEPL